MGSGGSLKLLLATMEIKTAQCVAVCCGALQCVAVCWLPGKYETAQCVAVCCSVLQCVAVCWLPCNKKQLSVLQCAAVCHSVLQCGGFQKNMK